jgi:hypothetical protein
MKLAVISMIRDEADIIRPFLRHLAALFDLVFLLDQRSSDGTSEIIRQACATRVGWSHWHMDFAGRHQKEAVTLFMARAFEDGADAVFLLDCDEFIDVRTRAELETAAATMQEHAAIGHFRWKACVPLQFGRWQFDPSETVWIAHDEAPNPKIAIPRSLFQSIPRLCVAQGNHNALDADGNQVGTRLPLGRLLHVAVRSRQQFLQKVFVSAIANLAKNNPMTREGAHKRRFLEVIAGRDLSEMTLTSIAAQFPMLGKAPEWWSDPSDIARAGFSQGRMNVPFADLALPEPVRPELSQIVARCLMEYRLEDIEGGRGSLVLEGDRMRFQPLPD